MEVFDEKKSIFHEGPFKNNLLPIIFNVHLFQLRFLVRVHFVEIPTREKVIP